MSLWALRKASILAKYGKLDDAYALLQKALLYIRKRLLHQKQVNLALLSMESAMMNLQSYISQVLDRELRHSHKDGAQKEAEAIDSRRRAFHAQYNVAWEELDSYFISRLETEWKPYQVHRVRPTFDFGRKSESFHWGTNEDLILAYSFLRFREESGIPFHINSVNSSKKAACGAAERIALYAPVWSILTLVRADEPKAVENTITRGVLSGWTQEETDLRCQFYLGAILRTEEELSPEEWFYRRSFARLAADVLPEVLSEFYSKCSSSVLDKIFDLLKRLYQSEKKLCYQQVPSLIRRLFAAYPLEKLRTLIPQLLMFPIKDDDHITSSYFPNPLEYIHTTNNHLREKANESLPEVETLFDRYQQKGREPVVIRSLLYCLCHGLLTDGRKLTLCDFLWEGQRLHVPKGWLRTICLKLPAPSGINALQYLVQVLTENIEAYTGHGERPINDLVLLREIRAVVLGQSNAFSDD